MNNILQVFNSKLDTLQPNVEYWDYDDGSFQYILDNFFPYMIDLDFDMFCHLERKFIHLDTNFIPCFNKKWSAINNFSNLFPEYCQSCNISIKKNIEKILKNLINKFSSNPIFEFNEEYNKNLIPKQIEEYRLRVAYKVYLCELYPDIIEKFGDPCGLGIKTRKIIRDLIESKYYTFICESQKLSLLANIQSPIEKILLEELLSRGIFKDTFNVLDKSISISTQAAIFDNGSFLLEYIPNDPPFYIPEELNGKIPFTISDIFIQVKNRPHPGMRPKDDSKVIKWKQRVINWNKKNIRNLCIYADGHDYHEKTKSQAKRDRSIDRKLQFLGYVVYRFTGSEIYNDVNYCCDFIQRDIEQFMKNPIY
jgi:hypothetical protein